MPLLAAGRTQGDTQTYIPNAQVAQLGLPLPWLHTSQHLSGWNSQPRCLSEHHPHMVQCRTYVQDWTIHSASKRVSGHILSTPWAPRALHNPRPPAPKASRIFSHMSKITQSSHLIPKWKDSLEGTSDEGDLIPLTFRETYAHETPWALLEEQLSLLPAVDPPRRAPASCCSLAEPTPAAGKLTACQISPV